VLDSITSFTWITSITKYITFFIQLTETAIQYTKHTEQSQTARSRAKFYTTLAHKVTTDTVTQSLMQQSKGWGFMTGMLVVKQVVLFHAAANWEHHVAQISLTRVQWYLDISYDSRWSMPATKLHPREFTLCLLHKLQTLNIIQLTIIIRKNCNTVTSTLGFCLVFWYTVTCPCSPCFNSEWAAMTHTVIECTIGEWRQHLRACIVAGGEHFEHPLCCNKDDVICHVWLIWETLRQ